ncbi:hypothetical protein ACR79B_20705 [Sphingobacterium spiritivorum]|uniref:hypothetical protein n=1 Tax=Sphingobacterium spiritivorum TaxID=258 RepID=UPI003DA5AD6A
MDQFKRFSENNKVATDTYLEATKVFYPPHFDGTPNIGDADESKIGAIATYKTGSTTNLAIYQGGGVWREGTGYTDAEIDAMITAAKNRANHTGTQAINTIEGLEAALDGKISTSEKGVSNGVATLDINSKVPMSQVPDALIGSVNYQGNWNPATNTPTLPETPAASTKGHYYIASTTGTFNGVEYNNGDWIISNGAVWGKVDNTNKVVSVNGKQGSVVLNLSDIAGASDLVTLNTAQTITAKKTFRTPNATSGNAIAPIEVQGGNGAQVQATSGSAVAGSAANLNITAGNGGWSNGTNPSGTNLGGNGGTITILAGDGGVAIGGGTNLPGPGGNVVLQAGTGYTTGIAGQVELKAGNNDNGVGGDIYLTTGYGSGGPNSSIDAGNIYLGVSGAQHVRGNVLVGGISGDDNGNKFQVIGKASVSQAPTAPTDVVRLSDLGVKANSDGSNASGTWPIRSSGLGGYGYIDNDVTSDFDFAFVRNGSQNIKLISADNLKTKLNVVSLAGNESISGLKTFTQWTQSNQGFRSYATANSNAAYSPTGITFNTAANTYATIDANTSGGLTIRTADGSATAQPRMTFLTPNGATARSVMIAGRAYYKASYTGSFEANDLITKGYVDDKVQLITLRATISGGVAVLDGGAVESGYRYMVQGASLYNGTTPEFLSLSKLAIQAGTTGNVVAQYETTSVDNGKDVEVLILKIKI